MIKESEYWSKIIETELNKPIDMTKKNIKKILKILLNVGFVKLEKIKDLHITIGI